MTLEELIGKLRREGLPCNNDIKCPFAIEGKTKDFPCFEYDDCIVAMSVLIRKIVKEEIENKGTEEYH